MYKKATPNKTTIKVNTSMQGETIEVKMRRISENNEPITDGIEPIYTERKDGVQPAYDVRTDRWEIAVEAKDKIAKSFQAKRDASIKEREDIKNKAKDGMEKEGEGS